MAAKIILNTDNFTSENSSCQMSNITVTLEKVFPLELLKPIMDILMLILSVIVMLCIGCEVHWQKLKEHIKYPTCIGMILVCQFFIIPLMAYTLMRSSSVDGLYATEILIISCCPGGLLTNAFTYFCEGDLALSATMTSLSTLISFGTIPLNLWIYGRSYATENLILPYSELSLAFVSVPLLVIIGMLLRWKYTEISIFIFKVGKYIGLLILITCIIIETITVADAFNTLPSNIWGVAIALPLLGLSLGYLVANSFRQDVPKRKAVAIACGIQNFPIALEIINNSFDRKAHQNVLSLPYFYAFLTLVGYTILSIIYQIYIQFLLKKKNREHSFDLEHASTYL